MDRIPELGRAVALLRCLGGMSLIDAARRLGLSDEELRAAERGEVGAASRVAHAWGLDAQELLAGAMAGTNDHETIRGATVFLFHGAYQDFDATDLGVLERAMRVARIAATQMSEEATRRRLAFATVPPAGPTPRDAARQGHRLATYVRTKLGWGTERVGDLRELLEEVFGVVVLVERLDTSDLRAACVVDAERAAAAIVLSTEAISDHPLVARVYLAHELCHVLFDPLYPGRVRVVLDDRVDERRRALSTTSLLESRAKGFAAELLMPLEGLRELLGEPDAISEPTACRARIDHVREHFGTPWQIATYHLRNHGFLDDSALRLKPSTTAVHGDLVTSLPAPGTLPSFVTWPGVDAPIISEEAPAWVGEARERSRDALRAHSDAVLVTALNEIVGGASKHAEMRATDAVVDLLDDLLHARELDEAKRVLDALDAQRFPPGVLTGVLGTTKPAREELGTARVSLLERTGRALVERWGQAQDLADRTVQRLR
ncbi:MAG: ImmA/IrrE family metallo-endopeptidase [Myxococcales bacterium]|nr:ImmA/IrrE family metallo-endopeptidase [Myxococcales bacterium]